MRFWLLGLCCLWLAGCGDSAPVAQEAYVFGTRVEVVVWGVPEAKAHAALGEVLREFDRLHRAYHAWQPSELTALNEAIAAGRPHQVSAELASLIRTAQALAAQGEYLFDPGLGRLIALWGFQSDEFKPVLPDAETLKDLVAAKPSIADLRVADDGTVTSKNTAVALDFGGYLKGVALDRAAALLKARGIDDALINIGGNVLALGSKGGVPWRVGIRHPRVELAGEGVIATLELRDGEAIGTSGDYQRFFEVDGKRYCHLIDPRTGAPAQGTQSLTVLIPPGPEAGMRSDVLTKPLFIANDRWRELARRLGVTQVMRVDAQGRIFVTPAMQARLHFTMDDLDVKLVQ
ncbi:MAG: FAD:protein FMN transferase [Rhodocyclaceae bacterium]|jgi:thiamine biosynthesis lipoprotein|nr:FAD:protein FMN transferase [Rhodocyclaceae bacterium]